MVPLINNATATLRWFVEDVWAQFGDDHTRPTAPLLPSERKNTDGSAARVGDETLCAALAQVAQAHLPDWPEVITLTFCATSAPHSSSDPSDICRRRGGRFTAVAARATARAGLTP
ncbi:hypothetical protein [Nonomuraea sp. SYSU D8015]|uniref:hypothetical protein n=1 Tax=Nonomuraea sp. SYSU D8015 TaxID=2593644 RepID=UPI001CB6E203|nr:hypothetical protein [Nonomuraea sp. SYSU D8015]